MNHAQREALRQIPEGDKPGALVSDYPDGSVIWTDSQGGYYHIDTDGTTKRVKRPQTMREITAEAAVAPPNYAILAAVGLSDGGSKLAPRYRPPDSATLYPDSPSGQRQALAEAANRGRTRDVKSFYRTLSVAGYSFPVILILSWRLDQTVTED